MIRIPKLAYCILLILPLASQERLVQPEGRDPAQPFAGGELPWAVREMESLREHAACDLFLGRDATESAFKAHAPNHRILHLATHALIDDQAPMHSRLLFSPDPDGAEDGDLHVYELYNMQLDAELAVLSACNTGSGKLVRGEGVLSLARGFFHAGCPSVVMSLWPVPDQSTALIMDHFYRGLAMGKSKDAALREAKLAFLETADEISAHPFYWAGLVTIGDPGVVDWPAPRRRLRWIATTLVLLACLIVASAVRAHRRNKGNTHSAS